MPDLSNGQGLATRLCMLAILAIAHSRVQAVVRYVDASAGGANNGTSWSNAYTRLQPALAAAGVGDQIWLAAATYRPAGIGGRRTATFEVKTAVALYGGFPVGGGAFEQRDPNLFITTLSGDLNGNDAVLLDPFHATTQDNSFHVVTGSGTISTALLDGFTVERGFTQPGGSSNTHGGGLINVGGSPTINNCVFYANWGRSAGGCYNHAGSDALFTQCVFLTNRAEDDGGGMKNENSNPTLMNCEFEGNRADESAGAIMNI